jgi:hypothetical protein
MPKFQEFGLAQVVHNACSNSVTQYIDCGAETIPGNMTWKDSVENQGDIQAIV